MVVQSYNLSIFTTQTVEVNFLIHIFLLLPNPFTRRLAFAMQTVHVRQILNRDYIIKWTEIMILLTTALLPVVMTLCTLYFVIIIFHNNK